MRPRPAPTPARLWVGAAACLVLLAFGLRSADAEPRPIKPVRTELRKRLHDMAAFCTARKLFASRYDVYEVIIGLWRDDGVARKSNGYTENEGTWSPKGRKRPRNLAAGGLPALRILQDETVTWYRAAIADATRDLEPGTRAAWRARALGDAVRIAPDNLALREEFGEVRGRDAKGKKGWILLETQKSRARRPALRSAAKKALRVAPKPTADTPRAGETSSTVTWTTAIKGGRARLTGVTDPKELAQILRNVNATFPFFQSAFGQAPPPLNGLTIHVLNDTSTGNVYLADQPGVEQSWLKFVAPLIALWIPKSVRVLIKSPEAAVRLEGAPRMVNSAFMNQRFGVRSRMGWAVEGFGLYLTWHITGTRMINAVRESQYGEKEEKVDLAKRLRAAGADWVAEARALVNGRYAPDLRLLLGKTVNTMTPEDVLYSYALAMFLVEGHHEKLGLLLPALASAKGADFDLAFAEHLGFDVATVERRIKRWLNETASIK